MLVSASSIDVWSLTLTKTEEGDVDIQTPPTKKFQMKPSEHSETKVTKNVMGMGSKFQSESKLAMTCHAGVGGDTLVSPIQAASKTQLQMKSAAVVGAMDAMDPEKKVTQAKAKTLPGSKLKSKARTKSCRKMFLLQLASTPLNVVQKKPKSHSKYYPFKTHKLSLRETIHGWW